MLKEIKKLEKIIDEQASIVKVLKEYVMKWDWEEIPHEELWEDGELMRHDVISKIVYRVLDRGDWKLMGERDKPYYKLKGEE